MKKDLTIPVTEVNNEYMISLFLKSKSAIIMILISSIGIVLFIGVTALFPFKSKLFSLLYGKPISQAAEGPGIPSVELGIYEIGQKHINLSRDKTSVKLVWKTTNVKSCIGRSWGISDKDETWTGPKSTGGGSFDTANLTNNNAYIYTINCANEFGDSAGDAVVINIGASKSLQYPYITSFNVTVGGEKFDLSKPVLVNIGDNLKISWTNLNLSTPYSVCFASGSWPTIYQNSSKTEVVENFTLSEFKVYRYSLYCSNEAGITKKTVTLTPS